MNAEAMQGHRIAIDFDGGMFSVKLLCPQDGCEPASVCTECGRHVEDDEREACYSCKDGFGNECVLKAWVENVGSELLAGMVVLDVKNVVWEADEGPTLEVAVPSA